MAAYQVQSHMAEEAEWPEQAGPEHGQAGSEEPAGQARPAEWAEWTRRAESSGPAGRLGKLRRPGRLGRLGQLGLSSSIYE